MSKWPNHGFCFIIIFILLHLDRHLLCYPSFMTIVSKFDFDQWSKLNHHNFKSNGTLNKCIVKWKNTFFFKSQLIEHYHLFLKYSNIKKYFGSIDHLFHYHHYTIAVYITRMFKAFSSCLAKANNKKNNLHFFRIVQYLSSR